MLGGGAMGAFTDVVRENSKIGMRGGGGGSVKAYDLALAPCCQRSATRCHHSGSSSVVNCIFVGDEYFVALYVT